MKIVEVKNLCKNYGKGTTLVKALDDVSFDVEEGEFVAIVGASGSGKSTLLHILGAVDHPTKGQVIIGGTDVYKQKEDDLACTINDITFIINKDLHDQFGDFIVEGTAENNRGLVLKPVNSSSGGGCGSCGGGC